MRSLTVEDSDSKNDFEAVRRHVRNVVRNVANKRARGLVTGAAGTGVLALAMLSGPAAIAAPQDAQPQEQTAQNAASGETLDSLEEVVVTAQFRAEKLQETPLAITAVTGDALRERNIDNLAQVADAAPNVSLDMTGSAFGPNMSAFIRGVGQGDFNFAFEPGVGIYVDDIYHATVAGSLFELLDLERVEVLRGPQGTLFGKNSIGGAIRMITAKPKGDGSAFIEGTYGEFSRKDIRGMFDISLVPDKLFMRVSAMSQSRDGYVDRLDYACVNPDLGASQGFVVNRSAPRLLERQTLANGNCVVGTEGGKDLQGARAAFRWLASERLEVNFAVDVMDDNSEAAATKLIVADTTITPGAPAVVGSNAAYLAQYGVQFDTRFITGANDYTNYSTFYDLQNDRTQPPVTHTEQYGGALSIDFDITDAIHLKAVTGYRGYSGNWSDDQDASPLPLAWVHQVVDHHQFSQELQFTGTAGKIDWATGLFYFDGFNLNRGHVNINIFGPPFDFDQDDPSNVKDKAAFVQGTYHFTDALGFTAGVRYTDEEKDYQYNHAFFPITKTDASYNRTDWKVGVDYKVTSDILAYAQVSTGFKGGGFNPRPFSGSQVTSFGPETLRSHEIGLKSEWFDRKLRMNAAIFQSDYKDLQFNSQTIDANGAPFVGTTNVGEVDIRGLELEIDSRPIEGLLINAAVGYTKQEYKDLGTAIGCQALPAGTARPAPAANFNCVTNNPTLDDEPGGPKWRGNAGVQYAIALNNGSSITPRFDVNFQDGAPTGNSNDRYTFDDLAGYTLYNGRVTWASAEEDWAVSLSGTNLTDKFYYVNYFNLIAFGEGHAAAQPGRPREWAISVRRSF